MNTRIMLAAVVSLASVQSAWAQVVEEPPQSAAHGAASWIWRSPASREVIVNLARGDVRIVRTDRGETRIEAIAADPDGDGSPVTLVVQSGSKTVRMIDRYPSGPSVTARECLPPDGEHGDLWHYQESLTLTVTVPKGVRVSATTMAGLILGQ